MLTWKGGVGVRPREEVVEAIHSQLTEVRVMMWHVTARWNHVGC